MAATAILGPAELPQEDSELAKGLQYADPAIVRHIVDRTRAAGNEAFRQKRYKGEHVQEGREWGGRRRAAQLQGKRRCVASRVPLRCRIPLHQCSNHERRLCPQLECLPLSWIPLSRGCTDVQPGHCWRCR